MVVVPGVTAATCPPGDTVATAVDVDDHVIAAPVIVAPLASRAVGVSVEGWPGTNVSALWDSVSVATTGTVTVTVTVPDTDAFDELLARMVAVPADTAVMVADVPLPDTVATDGDSEVHVIDPLAPLGATVALTEPVAPANKASVGGATVIELTPGGWVGPSPPPPQPLRLTSPRRVAAQIWARRVIGLVGGRDPVPPSNASDFQNSAHES